MRDILLTACVVVQFVLFYMTVINLINALGSPNPMESLSYGFLSFVGLVCSCKLEQYYRWKL